MREGKAKLEGKIWRPWRMVRIRRGIMEQRVARNYSECTITLEDVALQLGPPVDVSVVTRSTIILHKKDLYATLLGKVLNSFEGGQIQMKWLETNLKKLAPHAIEVVKEQYA
ncbi:hypothetical protein J1N35_014569 [Gossypium stocksii]|uniref:Uncharacterized protein n=1 Tax=Gossypium stocksii TaxID=47602 RepID=A0A9D3VVN5_9ROSI|nr:hypothetical protein J1N35_014569 [Gossypium stocksii]